MSVEEQKLFLDSASEDERMNDFHLVCSDKNRNRVLQILMFVNAILLVACVLLTLTVLSVSSSSTLRASRGHIAEPYCKVIVLFMMAETGLLTIFFSLSSTSK
jgi:succinate dehydrogenase hydrophobic anchor subunit